MSIQTNQNNHKTPTESSKVLQQSAPQEKMITKLETNQNAQNTKEQKQLEMLNMSSISKASRFVLQNTKLQRS